MPELAAKYYVHPNMIAQWKRTVKESLPEVFSKQTDRSEPAREAELKDLHAKIGQLTVENDFYRVAGDGCPSPAPTPPDKPFGIRRFT